MKYIINIIRHVYRTYFDVLVRQVSNNYHHVNFNYFIFLTKFDNIPRFLNYHIKINYYYQLQQGQLKFIEKKNYFNYNPIVHTTVLFSLCKKINIYVKQKQLTCIFDSTDFVFVCCITSNNQWIVIVKNLDYLHI